MEIHYEGMEHFLELFFFCGGQLEEGEVLDG